MSRSEFLWAQLYRPKTVDECILPERIKTAFRRFVSQGDIPNLLLTGGPGVGKTTVAKAVIEELGAECYTINGSLQGNIDTLRNDIQQFASSISLMGSGRKYVILDEADYLNAQSTQPALRNFMEEFSKNCGFILTCNYPKRIIEPLRSRTTVVDFDLSREEKKQCGALFYKRCKQILEDREVEYDSKALMALVVDRMPDWRRILNDLQGYAGTGRIDTGILAVLDDQALDQLMHAIKEKDIKEIRKWVATNDVDGTTFFRKLHDKAEKLFVPQSVAALALILGKYQYQDAFVADKEINITACCTEIALECESK